MPKAAGVARNLVIVESPAKAGTISKYLGPDFDVIASMGHIRDLPSSKLGVDVAEQFTPQYVIPPKARTTIKKLKEAVKNKDVVYLATDLDREGEAISWHLAQALDLGSNPKLQVFRITFDEITKTAVTAAIASPRDINTALVDAQQARRVLDRLVGYTLSPVLWKKVYKGLSAGRVQSVALKLIVDREAERNAFQPVEYWSIAADLIHNSAEFEAKLVEYNAKKIEQLTISGGEEAQSIKADLEKAVYTVSNVEKKPLKRRPSAPYTTSSFQQDAVNRLGISSKNAMRSAQQLYEAGLITYMRTDSVDLAAEAVQAIRSYVQTEFGANYIPASPNRYQTKNKQAQEAHEAIRPTDPTRSAESLGLDGQTQKVYDLIRRRALASQMAEAELEQTQVTITAGKGVFRATGQRIVFPGFLAVTQKDTDDEQKLPALAANDALTLHQLKADQHFTEPPPRFTEATLIKALEENGIGRPSTYAPTIDTLVQRKYVLLEQRRFAPEEVGVIVTNLLAEHFPDIVDVTFTASMEEKLDKIADGDASYVGVLKDFWAPFKQNVDQKTESIAKVDMTEETDKVCPNCSSPMIIKTGRFGKFLACSNFPECKTTQPIQEAKPTGMICPRDCKPLIWKRARKGQFLGCSGYPDCKFALWKPEQLAAKIADLEKEGETLPHKQAALDALAALPKTK